jgi:hypothetical protein
MLASSCRLATVQSLESPSDGNASGSTAIAFLILVRYEKPGFFKKPGFWAIVHPTENLYKFSQRHRIVKNKIISNQIL